MTPPASPRVLSVQTGAIAPLGRKPVPSAFVKTPIGGPIRVTRLGLAGDAQADRRVHGGPDKAVYAYAMANYAAWAAETPHHAALLTPGGFGENLTIGGLTEADLCAGDIHAIGTAILQLCQPRQPCFKLALRFADGRMPRAMVRNGLSGWYYRVLEEGTLSPGDALRPIARPHPDLPLPRLTDILNRNTATRAERAAIAAAAGVAEYVRKSVTREMF